MAQSFTLNQCLRLVYNELTPEESYMLGEIIDSNESLETEYKRMKAARRSLDESIVSPRRSVVDNILTYSNNCQLQFSC